MNYRKAGWNTLGALSLALIPTAAHALGTPANTEIRNQSTATYLDSALDPQVTTSNEVINIVRAVYGFSIQPNVSANSSDDPNDSWDVGPALTQRTAAGNIAYFSYVLRNTANTQDSFRFQAFYDADDPDTGGADEAVNADALSPVEVKVYFDSNGNGQVDPGDVLLVTTNGTGLLGNPQESGATIVATPQIPANGLASIVVAVRTPVTATAADSIYVDIDASSVGGGVGVTDDIANVAQVTFAESEGVLTVTKGADVASAIAGQTITYRVEGSNTGGAEIYSVEMDGTDPDTNPSISYNSDATADEVEGVIIIDDLDDRYLDVGVGTDYSYVTPTNISPASAIVLYWDNVNDLWRNDKANANPLDGADLDARIALFIPEQGGVNDDDVIDAVLDVGQSYGVTFTVRVNSVDSVVEGKEIVNNATGVYAYSAVSGPVEADSNDAIVKVAQDTVTSRAAVIIGPFGEPDGSTHAELQLTDTDHPRIDSLGINSPANTDATYAGISTDSTATRYAGDAIVFPLTVQNTGNAADIFSIRFALAAGDSTGYAVQLFKSDGIVPLADTNNDGAVDTGTVAVNGTVNIVARVIIADNAQNTDPVSWTVTAVSVRDGTKTDPTTIVVSAVSPAGVDIATDGETGGNDNTGTVSATAANLDDDDDSHGSANQAIPGTNVLYQVDVANIRPRFQDAGTTPAADTRTRKADTYSLAYEVLGQGVNDEPIAVAFYSDAGDDGVLATAELLQISDTAELQSIAPASLADPAAGQPDDVFDLAVRAWIPEGTPAGDYYINVTATSANNSGKSDTVVLKLTVAQVGAIDILPDNSATVVPGGSFVFNHLVVNNGNVAEAANLSLDTTEYPLPAGWTAVWVSCTDGSILGTGVTATTAVIQPGASTPVCLRVFVPTNAAIGSTIPVQVVATGATTAAVGDAIDVVSVISGNLVLKKSADPISGTLVSPGDDIEYTTTYKNLGSGDVTDVIIFDALPANTTVDLTNLVNITGELPDGTDVDAANEPEYFQYSTNGGISYTAIDTPVDASTVTHIRFDLTVGGTLDGTVAPGEGGSFVFHVTVD